MQCIFVPYLKSIFFFLFSYCIRNDYKRSTHSNKLNYTMQGSFHATLQAEGGGSAPAISRTWLETPTQYLVVQLGTPLQQGQRYRLSSSFTGELADDLAGFYRSEYTDESGNK